MQTEFHLVNASAQTVRLPKHKGYEDVRLRCARQFSAKVASRYAQTDTMTDIGGSALLL